MKKIINGKRYDTDTAEAVAYWDSEVGKSSFLWYEETLYQKRGGEFFLHGYGHAASPYAQSDGEGGSDPGEKITPLTYDEAREWAETHLDADRYEELFPVTDDDETMRSAADCMRLREKTGMKRTTFCDHIGIPYRTWQSWEMGDRHIPAYIFDLVETKLKYDGIIAK